MAVTGKLQVDLYANPDPFVQGMKAAENSAKKSGEGIAGHLDKINKKQMKNIGHELLGGLGTIGLADAGLKMGAELMQGLNDGTVKTFGQGVKKVGDALIGFIESIPVAGAALKLGQSIRMAISGGINEPSAEWAAGWEKNSAKVNASVKTVQDSLKNISDIVKEQTKSDNDKNSKLDSFDKDRIKFIERLTEAYKKANDAQRNKAYLDGGGSADADKIEADYAKRQKANESEIRYQNEQKEQRDWQSKRDAIELKARTDGESLINDVLKKRHEFNMSERDILKEKLNESRRYYGITQTQMDDTLKAYDDLQKQIKDKEDAEKKVTQELKQQQDLLDMIAESDKEQEKAQEDFDKTKAGLEEQAANLSSTTGVSSAIGDVKVAGAADFSIEKQLSMAQEALQAANDSVECLRIISDQLKTAGATT